MPEVDEEAVFGLDFEFFHVETDAARIVSYVAYERVGASFGGGEAIVFASVGFLVVADCVALPTGSLLSPFLFSFFSEDRAALLLFVEWPALVRALELKADPYVAEHQGYARKR